MKPILNREELKNAFRERSRTKDWAYLSCGIRFFEQFEQIYGPVASETILAFTAHLLSDVVDEIGLPDDVIGDLGKDGFAIITKIALADSVVTCLKTRFSAEILEHYSQVDRDRGYIIARDKIGKELKVPLMRLAVGKISAADRFG